MIKMLEGMLNEAKVISSTRTHDVDRLVTGMRTLITFLKAMDTSE